MVETVDAAGQTINKSFDELSRLTGIELTVEDTATFTYDALGQKTSAVDGDSSLPWTYDGANRVATAETVAGPLNIQPAVVLTHEYDAVGNRSGLTHGPDGVIVDGAWSYLHDGDGSLTQVTTPVGDTVNLTYDAASRLETVVSANTAGMTAAHEAWLEGTRYLNMEHMAEYKKEQMRKLEEAA